MTRPLWICLFASGCFVGFPPLGEQGWLDSAAPLQPPDCAAQSVEPDDAESDDEFSSYGLLTDEPRTLCGEVDARDQDYALFQTLEPGRVHLELDEDLELQVYDANTAEWTRGDDGEIELSLDPGFHTVLVAGTEGDSEYVLAGWVE